MVCRTNIGINEEFASFLEGPVVGYGVFLLRIFLNVLYYGLERSIVLDKVIRGRRSNFRDLI